MDLDIPRVAMSCGIVNPEHSKTTKPCLLFAPRSVFIAWSRKAPMKNSWRRSWCENKTSAASPCRKRKTGSRTTTMRSEPGELLFSGQLLTTHGTKGLLVTGTNRGRPCSISSCCAPAAGDAPRLRPPWWRPPSAARRRATACHLRRSWRCEERKAKIWENLGFQSDNEDVAWCHSSNTRGKEEKSLISFLGNMT